jgi:hypothetical protein
VYYIETAFNGMWKYASTRKIMLEQLLTAVANYYHIPQVNRPTIRIVRRIKGGHAALYGEDLIELSREGEGDNPMVLLHEVAHWLVDELYEGKEVQDHGPEFVAILMHLYDKYSLIPHEFFRVLARRHRVKIGRRYRPCAFRTKPC